MTPWFCANLTESRKFAHLVMWGLCNTQAARSINHHVLPAFSHPSQPEKVENCRAEGCKRQDGVNEQEFTPCITSLALSEPSASGLWQGSFVGQEQCHRHGCNKEIFVTTIGLQHRIRTSFQAGCLEY